MSTAKKIFFGKRHRSFKKVEKPCFKIKESCENK